MDEMTVEVHLDRLMIGAPDASPAPVRDAMEGARIPLDTIPLSAEQLSMVDSAVTTAVRDALGPPPC